MRSRLIPLLVGSLVSGAALTGQVEYAPESLAACRAEMSTLCQGTKNGGGRILACLKANEPKLSSPCKAAAIAPPTDMTDGTPGVNLAVEIDGVRSDKGFVWLMIDNDAAVFPRGRHRMIVVPAKSGNMTLTFHGLKPGPYAFTVYHDENDNGQLDNQEDGHLEGFAYSNNVMTYSFEKSKLDLKADSKAVVRLFYELPGRK
jgi:uncharacterized protein (DUF2141 family)